MRAVGSRRRAMVAMDPSEVGMTSRRIVAHAFETKQRIEGEWVERDIGRSI